MPNATRTPPLATKLKGYLVIYVDGYKVYDKYLVHAFSDGETTISIPDRLMPPPIHEIGSMRWWMEGWAVGDNSRGRLCSRSGTTPVRRFYYYDEVVAYVFARQKKHKDQKHVLVYVTNGVGGQEKKHVIHSMDDIVTVDTEIAVEIAEHESALALYRAETELEHPHLDALQEKYGRSSGWALSYFLKDLRETGAKAVKAKMSSSNFYRQIKRLREAGIDVL